MCVCVVLGELGGPEYTFYCKTEDILGQVLNLVIKVGRRGWGICHYVSERPPKTRKYVCECFVMLQLKEYLKHKYILTRCNPVKILMHTQTHTHLHIPI